ncbi:MAG: hypothetical protein ACOCTT_03215 [archaeon]
MPEKVYHSSRKQNLETIKPTKSTHGKKYVYATKNKSLSAAFLGKGGDLICQIGTHVSESGEKTHHIFERFPKALEWAYKNIKGSIYTLPGEKFEEGKTTWKSEVVSTEKVIPLEEEKIDNALGYLLELDKKGKIKIMRYPERPDNFPRDNSDLVPKITKWVKKDGETTLKAVKKYHPHLLKKVEEKLE